MHKARYWLLLKTTQAPKAITYGAGGLIAALLVAVAVSTTIWLDRAHTAERHAEAVRLFDSLINESTQLLDQLSAADTLQCTQSDLAELNSHLLQTRYIREIGIMNNNMALICSTALGALADPIKGNYPVHLSLSGLELLNNVPLSMANKRQHAIILRKPPYNVAVSPFVTTDVYANADASWLRTEDGLVLLNSILTPDTLASMQEHARKASLTRFRMAGLNYELTTVAPRSFVYELEEASVRASLIPEIIHIATAINAHTVAEGIETLEQARLLTQAGARYGQGYALARPMSIADFIAFMAKYR